MTHRTNPAIPTQLIAQFLKTVRQPVHGYSEEAAENKTLFHRRGKALLQRIAQDLGYASGSYDLRNNKAGPAVSGEITLHTNDLYVQFSCSIFGEHHQILFRRCAHRRDYTGERNHFLPFLAMRDYRMVIEKLQALCSQPG